MLTGNIATGSHCVTSQVGSFGVSATLEASRDSYQFGGGHVIAQQIFSGACDFPLNCYRRWINAIRILVNENAILGLQQNVILVITVQGFPKINAEHFHRAIAGATKDLRIIKLGVGGEATCQIDRIAEMGHPVGDVFSRIAYFSTEDNHRGILETVAAEYADSVEWLQNQVSFGSIHRVPQAECEDFRRVVWRLQADNLGVRKRGLGEKVLVGMNEIGYLHAIVVGIFAGMKHMSIEVYRLIRVRQDGGKFDFVAILN